eukprot:6123238-Prymnesium_polylepis.1
MEEARGVEQWGLVKVFDNDSTNRRQEAAIEQYNADWPKKNQHPRDCERKAVPLVQSGFVTCKDLVVLGVTIAADGGLVVEERVLLSAVVVEANAVPSPKNIRAQGGGEAKGEHKRRRQSLQQPCANRSARGASPLNAH